MTGKYEIIDVSDFLDGSRLFIHHTIEDQEKAEFICECHCMGVANIIVAALGLFNQCQKSTDEPEKQKSKYILGRDFIAMMRPILGINQESIVSLSITAKHDDATRVEIQCLGKNGANVEVIDITASDDPIETRKFLVEVTEVK